MPKAVFYYRAYCVLAAVLNLELAAGSVWLILNQDRMASEWVPGYVWGLMGWLFLPTGLGFGAINLWLCRVRRIEGHWAMHLGNIVLGVASCCLTPLCLPLMLAWLRPEVKEWFASG